MVAGGGVGGGELPWSSKITFIGLTREVLIKRKEKRPEEPLSPDVLCFLLRAAVAPIGFLSIVFVYFKPGMIGTRHCWVYFSRLSHFHSPLPN